MQTTPLQYTSFASLMNCIGLYIRNLICSVFAGKCKYSVFKHLYGTTFDEVGLSYSLLKRVKVKMVSE